MPLPLLVLGIRRRRRGAAVGEVGGADVGRRLRVGGSELAGEAHTVLVRVAPHLALFCSL